jgi:hypothetical protein
LIFFIIHPVILRQAQDDSWNTEHDV